MFNTNLNHYLIIIILTGIEEKRNAAYMRSSSASSVYGNNYALWNPVYATDGLYSFQNGIEIFASEWETAPWIMITLDGPQVISFVRVYNKDDCCGKLCLLHVFKNM